MGWFEDDARTALRIARNQEQEQPVALVLRLDDLLGYAMASASGLSELQLRDWANIPDRQPVVVTAVPRSQLIEGLSAIGHDVTHVVESTGHGQEVLVLVGFGKVTCLPLSNPQPSMVREEPTLTGEICVYEGSSEQLACLVDNWEPSGDVTFPAVCLTPDGVVRLVTEDMLAPASLKVAVTAIQLVAAEGDVGAFFTQRRNPGSPDDGGVRMGELLKALGVPVGGSQFGCDSVGMFGFGNSKDWVN